MLLISSATDQLLDWSGGGLDDPDVLDCSPGDQISSRQEWMMLCV
jgi:hypothetical protein